MVQKIQIGDRNDLCGAGARISSGETHGPRRTARARATRTAASPAGATRSSALIRHIAGRRHGAGRTGSDRAGPSRMTRKGRAPGRAGRPPGGREDRTSQLMGVFADACSLPKRGPIVEQDSHGRTPRMLSRPFWRHGKCRNSFDFKE
jgi:hypothetical protein